MYGPTQATQFRLTGPGKKEELAKEIIYKLPISTYNHIVKAGLKGRFQYLVKTIFPEALYRSVFRLSK
jgi:dimethylaniline monooxygenase (N-oxide forming)